MAAVISNYFSRKQIELANALIVRPVTFPPGWSRARVGIRAAFSGANHVTPTFGIGICSGTSAVLGDPSVTHFIGMLSTGNWTYTGGGRYASGSVGWGKQVGTTFTPAGSATGYDASDVGTLDYFECYFVDIIKGSPNYTIETYLNDNTPAANPVNQATFLSKMAVNGGLNGHLTSYYFMSGAVACNEAVNGVFNAINVYWSNQTTKLVIEDIAFAAF